MNYRLPRLHTLVDIALLAAAITIVVTNVSALPAFFGFDSVDGRRPASKGARVDVVSPVDVQVGSSPLLGAADSRVVVIEFSDFGCVFCKQFVENTLPAVTRAAIDSGAASFVFKSFPLRPDGPTHRAAALGHCLPSSDFWRWHSYWFRRTVDWSAPDFDKALADLALDSDAATECANSVGLTRIADDMALGRTLGVTGTPTFMLGVRRPGTDLVTVSRRIVGMIGSDELLDAIEATTE
jgi:protein-disulfide isomerase